MNIKEIKELGIDCWPDNDGGLYYFDPVTGQAKTVVE